MRNLLFFLKAISVVGMIAFLFVAIAIFDAYVHAAEQQPKKFVPYYVEPKNSQLLEIKNWYEYEVSKQQKNNEEQIYKEKQNANIPSVPEHN